MWHEEAVKLDAKHKGDVLLHQGTRWLRLGVIPPSFSRDHSYAVITHERTIVSGGVDISDAELIAAADGLGQGNPLDVINHRGEVIKSYGLAPVDLTAPRFTDPYADLRRILDDALQQASQGKGAERHANGLSFDRQPMQTLSDQLQSPDGMAFQAMKKIREARGLPTLEAKRRELLGAINYVAGMVLWYERNEGEQHDRSSS